MTSDSLRRQLEAVAWQPAAVPGAGQTVHVPAGGRVAHLSLADDAAPAGLQPAVAFHWDSFGARLSSAASLWLLPLAGGKVALLHEPDQAPLQAIARCDALSDFAPFFHELVAGNGAAFGITLFPSLPTLTVNHRPDLLPEAAVEAAYRAFMDGPAADLFAAPWRHLKQTLKDLQSPPRIRIGKAHGGRHKEKVETMSAAEKERLFERYLELAYKEEAN